MGPGLACVGRHTGAPVTAREQGEAAKLLNLMAAALWARQAAGTLDPNEWELLARAERFLRLEAPPPQPAAVAE